MISVFIFNVLDFFFFFVLSVKCGCRHSVCFTFHGVATVNAIIRLL